MKLWGGRFTRSARDHNVPVAVTRKDPYSRDQNIWHLSHEGGPLETKLGEPPEEA